MAQKTELEVTPRTVMGKAAKQLRRVGIIPANIYGHKQAPQAVQIEEAAFDRLRRGHGTRHILTLRFPNTHSTQTVLLRHVQHAPTGGILHVDFTRVTLSETIKSKVPLHFVGDAPGVKVEGGMLLHIMEAVDVECRAGDIIDHVDVDITSLAEIGAVLHAKDVKLPKNFKLVTDPEESIVKIEPPRMAREEEEAAAAPAAPEAAAETPAAPAPSTEA